MLHGLSCEEAPHHPTAWHRAPRRYGHWPWNGSYMTPTDMTSTELVAYLSLPCWYQDDRSGRRERSLTIPPRWSREMVSATWTSDTQTTISPGTLR